LDKYLNDISKIDLLEPEEEIELAERINEGDEVALEKLTQANLRFVVSVAKQYQNHGLSLSDLINEGNVGLMKAAKRFDPTKGFKFISYAVWWIRQSILQAILEYSRLVRLPLNKVNLYSKVKDARDSFIQEFEREPSVAELADAVGVTVKEVEDILENGAHHLSLDAPIGKDEDSSGTMLDVYIEEDNESPDLDVMEESLQNELKYGLSTLSPREMDILKFYFGIGDDEAMTLEEIGDRLGLTRERVRQIKERALRRLRKKVNKGTLRSYL
jgi:RNA polymerase primary sigma factor